ncbi:hypothetical protein [Hyella patelloides]|uniref:hypothetical protein n=1 Tax=Hyella patelloides TaxID=1982969 RepID=UPI0016439715|nr:hypothetical protein [Hyella patelloides]
MKSEVRSQKSEVRSSKESTTNNQQPATSHEPYAERYPLGRATNKKRRATSY